MSTREVLIDITRLVHRFMKKRLPTGIDRVSLAYIAHFGPTARAVMRHEGGKFVFRRTESKALFDWLLRDDRSASPMPIIYKGFVTGCLAQRVAGSFLFNTGHSGLESADYVDMLRQQGVRPVFLIYDLIPLTHPQFCRVGEQAKHMARMRHAMSVASGVLCISQSTLSDLTQLCRTHGWAMPPHAVALLASALPHFPATVRSIDSPYFVFVSTIEPRKNHLLILRVWRQLQLVMGSATPRLLIIGQRGWDYTEVTDLLGESGDVQHLVTEISECTDAELASHLSHARALVFPSFAEGYGMPVVEALAHGVPVIASDLAVFREFAGAIPDYIDTNEEARWVQAVQDFSADNSPRRQDQLRRLQGFVPPAWTGHFQTVDAFLDQLDCNPSNGRDGRRERIAA